MTWASMVWPGGTDTDVIEEGEEGLDKVVAELEEELGTGSRLEVAEAMGKLAEGQVGGKADPKDGLAFPGDDCGVPKRPTLQGSKHWTLLDNTRGLSVKHDVSICKGGMAAVTPCQEAPGMPLNLVLLRTSHLDCIHSGG